MARILMVSKPVVPPWHDSSKNLVRDVASHLTRHVPVLLTQRGAEARTREAAPGLARAELRGVYPRPGRYAPALLDQARVLSTLLLGRREDVWHFFFAPNPRSSRAAALASRARRVPTVQTVCSAPAESAHLPSILFGDRIVVLSEHMERRALAAGIEPARLRRIPPAVAALEPFSDDARRRARERFVVPADAPLVVYPGDLEVSRGAERAIRLHAQLQDDAWLVMACRPKTPRAHERERELRAMAEALGAAARVRWMGETPDIHALLATADVVALPSEDLYAKMDLPLVLIEAMLLKRPVLVLAQTAAAELARDGAAVIGAPDADALAERVQKLLADPRERARIGELARGAALSRYSPATVAAAYDSLYDELLG